MLAGAPAGRGGRLALIRREGGAGTATYTIEPERHTLHGTYSRERAPVLEVDPGDTVRFRTLIAGWRLDRAGTWFTPRDPKADWGHALCGPVAIRGARPGWMLGVRIGAIRTGTWGRSSGGGGAWGVNTRLGLDGPPGAVLEWTLDPDALLGRDQLGHRIPLRPFMGNLGMPPDEPGLHSTYPPRRTGGNIDCRELVAGSTLFLPVAVAGGLFSIGDGHAAQGDGEVAGPAVECPMDAVDITFDLHGDRPLATPHAMTPAGWVTFGFHEDLDEAAMGALDAMLDLMVALLRLPDRSHALALATAIVHLRVTQIVNGVRGVHALLPHGALR